jgi:hypothetical protein
MSSDELVPPVSYNSFWLWLGISSFVILLLIIAAILFFTRHKEPKTIASLKTLTHDKDYEAIRRKYLDIIAAIKTEYDTKKILARLAHQRISLATRQFVFEFSGIPAHKLTLTDLKKSADLDVLSSLISNIYPPEFAKVDHGSVANSCAAAEEVIKQWR